MRAHFLAGQVLGFLHCPVRRPDLPTLNRLLAAYVCAVPWHCDPLAAGSLAHAAHFGRDETVLATALGLVELT
jgi:hypothetical protein